MSGNPPGRLADAALPDWLSRALAGYASYTPHALLLGTILCLLALFTNSIPDPSFPWFSLPAELRLPLTQPRIEHWPVTYTMGIWLWIFFAPGVFLLGYELLSTRWGLGPGVWLLGLPTISMVALTTYCRFFWPKPSPATWNAPAYTFVCWAYCSTYDPLWSNLAYAIAAIGLVGFAFTVRRSSLTVATEATFGVLALPLGLPALFDAYRRTIGTHS